MSDRCAYCNEEVRPEFYASDIKCGWAEDGKTVQANWNCGLLNKIRGYAYDKGYGEHDSRGWHSRCNDSSIGVLWVGEDPDSDDSWGGSGGYLVLTWYKDRGALDSIYWADNPEREITRDEAVSILRILDFWNDYHEKWEEVQDSRVCYSYAQEQHRLRKEGGAA